MITLLLRRVSIGEIAPDHGFEHSLIIIIIIIIIVIIIFWWVFIMNLVIVIMIIVVMVIVIMMLIVMVMMPVPMLHMYDVQIDLEGLIDVVGAAVEGPADDRGAGFLRSDVPLEAGLEPTERETSFVGEQVCLHLRGTERSC